MLKKRSLVDAAKDPLIEKRNTGRSEQENEPTGSGQTSKSYLSIAAGFIVGLATGICIVLL